VSKHIIGKVYDVTAKSINDLAAQLDEANARIRKLENENRRLLLEAEALSEAHYRSNESVKELVEREAALIRALGSISRNSCCDTCQEAKLFAISALEANRKARGE
jgi:vacuolar-type H+-ATPase subunit I/STV1